MQQLDAIDLATVTGGQSFGEVIKAARTSSSVPVSQTYQSTINFITDNSFFHEGLMNAPIGGGKHFRNVPFVGPGQVIAGAVTGNRDAIAKGIQVTRGTWAAP